MMQDTLNRRGFLGRGLAVGCSLAASPLLTPVTFAATPSSNRLVVIVLRGGLDGLDLLRQPDSALVRQLRPGLSALRVPEMALRDGITLHPACAPLLPLWQQGELEFVQAVSTPYRNKRSHFDGQDLLESGTASLSGGGEREGWLNRLMQNMPSSEMTTAYAIGADPMLLSRGRAQIKSWSPDVDFVLSSQGARLLQMTLQSDPQMAAAMESAVDLAGLSGGGIVEVDPDTDMGKLDQMMDAQMDPRATSAGGAHRRVATFAAQQLRAEARIACFSLGGWDTHNKQANTLKTPLKRLSETLLTLKADMGAEVWGRTTVVAMTEFGRTVRENGTGGTDHGTGGAMILAGGALRGGRIMGRWPGLDEADLYDRRDLMPTDDVRRYAAWAIRSSFGLSRAALEDKVFPGLSLGEDPALLA